MGAEGNPVVQTTEDVDATEKVDALLEAARFDDIDDIISLVSSGVCLHSKDSQGRTALHMASANGHLGIVNYLIAQRVNVNAINLENNTPLHWACLNGHKEVVKILIEAGANISSLNSHDRTPMDEALRNGNMDVMDTINEVAAQLELSGATVS